MIDPGGARPSPSVDGDLFGQSDDDARGAAEVAEPEDALVLRHLAEECPRLPTGSTAFAVLGMDGSARQAGGDEPVG